MATKLQIRRDTAANWTSANPTLSAGEFGFETNTRKLKIGDGSTAWNSLAYFADELASGVDSAGIISLLGNGSVQHIIPAGNELYDLGDSNNRFRDLYLSGSTLNLGGVTLSVDSGGTLTLPEGTRVGSIRVLDSADVATIAGSLSGLDSTGVQNVINAAYIQANQITYNTSNFADSAFVTSQINALIDGAPGTLDTLNEIAAALNDDAAAYDTLLSLINAKTDYDSADTLSLIDSAYIQARQTTAPSGVDSAAVTALIDSAYIQARQTSGGSGTVDSAQVISIINNNTNSGFKWYSYTATQGQTTFQDSDNSGKVLSYDPDGIAVFYNGVLLTPNDFTASDQTSVVLTTAADSGENIAIMKWGVGYTPPDLTWGGDRAITAGGRYNDGSIVTDDRIQYYNIATPGNSSDFGNLTNTRNSTCAMSDTTYAVFASGGSTGAEQNTIDYITISTPSNATDFGDPTYGNYGKMGVSDGSRGLYAGGANQNTIEYITFATPSNTTDFGDMTTARAYGASGSNGTKGFFVGGNNVSNWYNIIEYVTIQSPGNGTDFGDLLSNLGYCQGSSNYTYHVIGGGYNGSSVVNTIQYYTMDTSSNSSDFGDLLNSLYQQSSSGNKNYCTWAGGAVGSTYQNVIQYVAIETPGNATDFGDLLDNRSAIDCGGTSGNAA